MDELVELGILHRECAQIFRIDKSDTDHRGKQLLLHQHQREAILEAQEGQSYVLTTGTGSGKSLAYIVPIVDHVLRRGSGRGIQAIVVYPMNALANSQDEELGKFIHRGYPQGQSLVRFARYTGQERGAAREAIRSNPPDILLTNYMMLELLLTARVSGRGQDMVSEREVVGSSPPAFGGGARARCPPPCSRAARWERTVSRPRGGPHSARRTSSTALHTTYAERR